ncbi:DegT/DnrJ/EryC1/StrS family aminotransferase [Streptomyces sp. NRRL S-1824]|uniref:DegT/DnrJ/EryC1/StrS family aminotransferase n=1 Tax=Streptomyces sp. NRRL S-1824 TaxID=1463889 RepID=UPI00068CC491|nr:DegT/DnrJ/EryC1/StrS family aminotransferase [Streptomyces sp. NRRL S-1824]
MSERLIPPSRVVIHEDEVADALTQARAILSSGRLTNGTYTAAFEEHLAAHFGAPYAIATSSGSSALEIIARMHDLAGSTVLVPVNTNFATAIAVMNAGAQVKFYDSGLYPVFESVMEAIDSRTKAIIVVHIGGHLWPELGKLAEHCAVNGILLIEDAAHAHGSRLEGRAAGQFGGATAFSFYQSKVLPTGEGGAILTHREDLAVQARRYRTQGLSVGTALHVNHGNTWRLSEFEAALGSILLRTLDNDCQHRTAAIRRYHTAAVEGLEFPALGVDEVLSGYKCIAILDDAELREQLRQRLLVDGVTLDREVYSVPLHRQPIFADLVNGQCFAEADNFAAHHICLPMWRGIEFDVVDAVIDGLRRHVG